MSTITLLAAAGTTALTYKLDQQSVRFESWLKDHIALVRGFGALLLVSAAILAILTAFPDAGLALGRLLLGASGGATLGMPGWFLADEQPWLSPAAGGVVGLLFAAVAL